MRLRHRQFARRAAAGFALLEVIVSLVVLGISVATLMRSFQMSLSAIHRNEITTRATILADQLIQDLELDPPARKKSGSSGTFEDQGHPQYSWNIEYKEEEIRYRNTPTKNRIDQKPLRYAKVKINYDDGRMKRFSPIELEVYLMPVERWTYQSKFYNELFKLEGKR
jgi:type II secretory pathway pseudopilin PulG